MSIKLSMILTNSLVVRNKYFYILYMDDSSSDSSSDDMPLISKLDNDNFDFNDWYINDEDMEILEKEIKEGNNISINDEQILEIILGYLIDVQFNIMAEGDEFKKMEKLIKLLKNHHYYTKKWEEIMKEYSILLNYEGQIKEMKEDESYDKYDIIKLKKKRKIFEKLENYFKRIRERKKKIEKTFTKNMIKHDKNVGKLISDYTYDGGKKKKIRKHPGINQQTGKLKKGYKYSGKLKSGLSKIVKVKK